jgi:hypothetical protein
MEGKGRMEMFSTRPALARLFVVVVVLACSWALAEGVASASAAQISSSGPLTSIGISEDLNCSVNHTGDVEGEFFDDTACGTFVTVGTSHYGPTFVPAGWQSAIHAGQSERGHRIRHRW